MRTAECIRNMQTGCRFSVFTFRTLSALWWTPSPCKVEMLLQMFTVTTSLENPEMSGNLTVVREMSGIVLKISEMSGKNFVREKLPETVYCKLHICVHTGI